MSTATEPRTAVVTRIRPEIASPLVKLRRAIRTYVVIEGLALAAAWVCVWLFATFLIDWGMFAIFGADYVRDGSDTARILLRGIFTLTLWGGLAYIVAYKVLYRLLATFNEPALALVLERRFPHLLEDRLVTAVELADPAIAETYGYSKPMIEDTTRQAAQRVEQVHLGQVFNRGRLMIWTGIAALLLLVVIVFAILGTNTAAIWMDRDLLLQDTYWPRRTMLELPDFADGDTKAVPYGGEFKVNVRALKWVAADDHTKEGWRRTVWPDVLAKHDSMRPWELEPGSFDMFFYPVLQGEWSHLSLDEVNARVDAIGLNSTATQSRAHMSELGHAVMALINEQMGHERSPGGIGGAVGAVDDRVLLLLRVADRQKATTITDPLARTLFVRDVNDEIVASQRLTPAEVQRLLNLLHGRYPTAEDLVQTTGASFSHITPPVFPMAWVWRALVGDGRAPHYILSGRDVEMLPALWREQATSELIAILEARQKVTLAEEYGQVMVQRFSDLFEDLDARAAQSHLGRRVQFRKLDVPNEVTIEFEQLQTDEERSRGKAKRATPKVKRVPGANDYVYEFKKIERPLRFRVVAGDDVTPWYTINVKPLPVLTSITRQQDELGYLHGANERVQTGPFPVSVEGSESKFDVPAGTRMRLEATSSKPLQWVQVKPVGQATEHAELGKRVGHAFTGQFGLEGPLGVMLAAAAEEKNPVVQKLEHVAGESRFNLTLRELAAEDVRLEVTFQDTDGITGRRLLAIGVLADKEPEFPRAGFEIVNRKMITAQAMIPFSGHIRDDHGLLGLYYEVTVERPDRTIALKKRFPMLGFSPLVVPAESRTGLRFDKREQVTPGRLMSATLADGRVGDAFFSPFVLGRLPATGYLGLWQFPTCDLAREYVFEYRQQPGSKVIVDEYFDSLLLRTEKDKPIQIDGKPLPVPYRLTIRLVAQDNRIRSGAKGEPVAASQESQSPETFDFAVVGEEELLLEAGKREEALHDTSEEIVTNLKKQHVLLQKIAAEFPSLQPNEFRRVAADVQDVLRALRDEKTRMDVEVIREFRSIYRELVLNRVTEQYLARVDQRICTPLERLLLPGQEFNRADDAIDRLGRLIEADKEKTPREALTTAAEETDNLIRKLEDILKEMKKLMEFTKALQLLQDIIKTQEGINDLLKKHYETEKNRELKDKP